MKLRQRVAVAAIAATPIIAAATYVAAAPYGCNTRINNGRTAIATCDSGDGDYRVVAQFRKTSGFTSLRYYAYGPWRTPGDWYSSQVTVAGTVTQASVGKRG